jgi:hypothetical protein
MEYGILLVLLLGMIMLISILTKGDNLVVRHDIIDKFLCICDFESEYTEGVSIYPTTYQACICHLCFDTSNNILHVHLRRPGILIGKGGRSIDGLKKELGCNIEIHEVVLGKKTKLK